MPKQKHEDWIKLQIQIPPMLHEKLLEKSNSMGFDSVQAYIRFFMKAAVDGRNIDFTPNNIPGRAALERWMASISYLKTYKQLLTDNIAKLQGEAEDLEDESEEDGLLRKILQNE